MKKFNYRAFNQYRYDIDVSRDDLTRFYPHVIMIANTFPRDSIAIGVLNIEDLIQAGNVGLVEAWNKVNWEKIDKSPNPNGELWSFLKKRIKGRIRREIDKYASFIARPINQQEEMRKNMNPNGVPQIFVSTFASFFDSLKFIADQPNVALWQTLLLEEVIDDGLNKYVVEKDHRDILKHFYGIGLFEKLSTKELAEQYDKSPNYISLIINRTKDKLRNDEFEALIDYTYENM